MLSGLAYLAGIGAGSALIMHGAGQMMKAAHILNDDHKKKHHSTKMTANWAAKTKQLIEKEQLDAGHKEAALAPLGGQESRFPSVNNLLHQNQLTPEEYVNYFVTLQARQGIKGGKIKE